MQKEEKEDECFVVHNGDVINMHTCIYVCVCLRALLFSDSSVLLTSHAFVCHYRGWRKV